MTDMLLSTLKIHTFGYAVHSLKIKRYTLEISSISESGIFFATNPRTIRTLFTTWNSDSEMTNKTEFKRNLLFKFAIGR